MRFDVVITVWTSHDFLGDPSGVAAALDRTGYWSGCRGAFFADGAWIGHAPEPDGSEDPCVSSIAVSSIAGLYDALLPADAMRLEPACAAIARVLERGWLRVLTEVSQRRDDLAFGEFTADARGAGCRELQCFARPVSRLFRSCTPATNPQDRRIVRS